LFGREARETLHGKGDVTIGNDVWLAANVIIMLGVRIGDGAVVAGGSVVTRDVDDYELVAGNPARHVRYRFDPEQVALLKEARWWDWPIEKIRENVAVLQSPDVARLRDLNERGAISSSRPGPRRAT
jgi:lipopolysaccharide transport system ATP-binding protein